MKREIQDIYRLTPLQQGMLFETLGAPETGAYFDQFVLRFEAGLDPDLLERAWRQVVERHPVLRTSLFWEEVEEPVQVVYREVELPFEWLDWRDLDAEVREARLTEFLDEDRALGFTLDQPPLLRLTAIRWSEGACRIVWSYHHLILDGWSSALVLREVAAAYEALVRGMAPVLEARRPFRDYVAWLRQQDLEAAEAYWRQAFSGFGEHTVLGIDRAVSRGDAHAEAAVVLSAGLTAALQETARRHRVTLYTLIEGAYALTLARSSGARDIVFGTTVSGRPYTLPGAEAMVGCFINTLPVRIRTAPEQGLAGWLRDLQEAQLERRRFEHSPLPQVKAWSGTPGDRPLFDAILVFENYASSPAAGRGSAWEGRQRTHFPLTLAAWPGQELELRAGFYTGRFEPLAVARLLRHLETVLSALATAPDGLALGGLPVLPESERHQVLVEWNDTRPGEALEGTVVDVFEARTRQAPEAVAVLWDSGEVTYRELDRRASRLARYLAGLGVRPGALVGLCCDRSPDLVAALLGVWKSGAAWLPLDPGYPDARLALLLEDAPVVLAGEPLLDRLAGLAPARALVLGLDAALAPGDEPEGWTSRAAPGDPAYVIYTSGTTGTPKGVVAEHQHLAATMAAARRAFAFSAVDRMPCLAPFSFDIFLFELLGPLLAGGTSVLFSLRPTLDVDALAARLGEMTLLHAVPALMRQVVEAARERGPWPDLRMAFVGGDAVPPDLLAGMAEVFPRARVQVLYGPTEATIICCREEVRDGWSGGRGATPVGRPLDGAEILLLDRWGDPVPIGVPGEVCIAGEGVTRGYLSRPELTAEKFPEILGRRVYRSGDLARHLPDGRLEFLGRADHQVKVRGFRIELGEIEAALATHPGVREAVVVARSDGSDRSDRSVRLQDDQRLVAYITGDATAEELRSALAARLPDYMVPAFFVLLEALPLGPHGKVDRHALPAPGRAATGVDAAPRTPFEELLAGVWEEVLGLPAGSVGSQDSFFALGGHSLLATQVVSRVRRLTGAVLPVRTLFEHPTVAGTAARLEAAMGAGPAGEEPLATTPRGDPLPLSFAQERLWFLARLEPESLAYNMSFQVRLQGALDAGALARSLSEVVRRHEVLRTTFAAAGGRPVQVVAPAAPVSLPVIDLSGLPEVARETETRRLAAREAARPFDLERGPMLRALLARLGAGEHRVLLNTHHIASDAWSTGVLFRELAAFYPAFHESRPSPLPELPVQYSDFAVWQRRRLHGERLAAQVAWWREQLGGEDVTPLELPTDRPRPPVQDHRGASCSLTLSSELSGSLAALGRREGASVFMVLLAAFQLLLGRWSGQDDVVVGTPVAGRDRQETEGLIGLFLNTLALRTRLAGHPTFRELLGRVRETALGAYAHHEVPFEKLVEELRPPRDLSRHPLFDVMLNLVSTPREPVEIPGLRLAFEEPSGTGSKFAFTLYVSDLGDRLHLNLVYQSALFTAGRATGLLDQLAVLLEQATADPARPIHSYSLVTPASRALLPDPSVPLPEPRYEPAPALVEARAAEVPDTVAVRQGDRSWTYTSLAASARGLSCLVRRGETVAVSGPPSFGLVAAMLAVLRGGGVLLTLDPALPQARLRLMAREAGVRLLLRIGNGIADLPGVETVQVDPVAGMDRTTDPAQPGPDDPAYIFFTSGSTGVPKAVLGCHKGISHFLAWQRETFNVGPGDRCAQLTALSFDALLRDVFLPLTSGAALCLPEAARLVPWLAREGITLLHTLPAVAQVWAGSREEPLPLPALRRVFFSGEPLTGALVARWRRAFPGDAALVNLYGPTETTMTKCFFVVPAEPEPGVQPLGRPLPATQALVLGADDLPCGIGEAGEIVLRTPFRTLGYLNAPEEMAQRFVPNPHLGDLLYRTGDRGRYRLDGSLEILGRLDGQVKVRGVRVEPGEIEAALLRHPAVAEAAVVAREDRGGERRLVAYIAPGPETGDLRAFLRQELPEPLLPAAFVVLDRLPLTPTGKIDRRALPDPEAAPPVPATAEPRTPLECAVAKIWQEVLQLDRVGLDENFFDLGGHSLRLLEVHSRLSALTGSELPLMELFRHPTVGALARYLEDLGQDEAPRPAAVAEAASGSRAIAIVGMAGRFPGAPDIEAFWRNLCDGVESVTVFSDPELLAAGNDPELLASPRYVRAGAVIDGIESFDAAFFGLTPREAEILDPQHRLLLECAWETLEGAGYDPQRYPHPIGVYAGVHRSTYLLNLYSQPELVRAVGDGILKQTTDKDYLATRISYKLGLRGPSFTVQTTCSTSLVAVHLACQGLLAGECRMALAGGVSVRVPQVQGYLREEGDILSPDGHTRAFDAAGRGTLFGNGLGLVLLKRLEDALADGDTIHAVIRGTAVNNDGDGKVGYTAPSIDGQAEVILAAQRAAGVDPDCITCVEAHGTATVLGDPIEIAALTRAFRASTDRKGFCALGSVKTNIGHLDTAAGVAGLIKTALALEHGKIPPSLHFETPNPNLDFAGSPFYVNTALAEWRTDGGPRRAGVSSFGIGGTNAHAVLEEPPRTETSGPARPWQVLLLSARTPSALKAATARLADHLESHPETALADAAFTLQAGRRVFEHRRAVVCRDREDALAALRSPERWITATGEAAGRPVAFLFPGQGAQFPGMGRELYATEPVFRAEVDRGCEILAPHLGLDLRELLFSADGELTRTRLAQPALFVVEYALARLWMGWGIRPAAMIGHSLGEYVAACLAGVFSLEDALALVAERGRLMDELPPGAMLAVSLPKEELQPRLAEVSLGLSLAAVNAPALCTVSGPHEAVEELARRLADDGVEHRPLHTSHAFHSAMMEPVLRPFAERVAAVELRAPRLRFLSNVTGNWIRPSEATDPGYWARHLREPVRFADGLATLLAEPGLALLEVGPGRTLSTLARRQGAPVIASMRHPRDERSDPEALLRALGRLWLAGVQPDWAVVHAGVRRRVPLPTYPFERRRHWVERRRASTPAATAPVVLLLPEGSSSLSPEWVSGLEAAGCRLVTVQPDRPEALAGLLASLGRAVPDEAERAPAEVPESPAGDALERRQLAALWEDLLGIRGIGLHDDFFELGGHSLMATRLVARVREVFRAELSIEAVFEAPTISRLAARVRAQTAAGEAPPAPHIPRVTRSERLPLSFAQQRLLFLEVLAPGDMSYNMPLGLRLRGALDPRALQAALEGLVDRHEILRTTYALAGGNAWQVIASPPAPGSYPLPLTDLGALPPDAAEEEARSLADAEFRRPVDLFQGPVFRTVLLRLGPEDHALLITVHHIAIDGWSWGVLYAELVELYEALCEGRAPRLPALPVQYADYAAWQRSWLTGEELERQIDYWRGRLAGLPWTEVPPDRPRPPVRTGRGAVEPFTFPAEPTEALRRLARGEDATLFMVLLSAFGVLLHHYGRGDDLVVGTDVANRRWREAEGLLGLFVNQLVLRLDLSGDPVFRDLLRRVRRVTLDAYAHQDVPFDRLVEMLNPVRDMSRTPLFQAKLVLQNASIEARTARGLTASLLGFHNQTAKFDLLLNLSENAAGLTGSLEHSTDLYERETMAALLGDFATVLRIATGRPDARLSEIEEALAERERTARERRVQERRETRSRAVERVRRKAIAVPQG